MRVKVDIDGQVATLEVTRRGDVLSVTRGDETTEVRLLHQNGPHFVLEYVQGEGATAVRKRIRAAGVVDGDRRQLWVNGRSLTYERLRERPSSAAGGGPAGSLAATIPAVVAEILVAPGDQVTAGQKLLLLESMKMVIPIQAPYAGEVSQINCAVGDAIQPGVPLVELKPAE